MSYWVLFPSFIACVGAATYIQNLTGFAFGLVLLSLVAVFHLVPMSDAANAATVLTLVSTVVYFRLHKLHPEWRVIQPAILPSLAGVAAGVMLLSWLSGNAIQSLRALLGLATLACAGMLLANIQARSSLSGRGPFAFAGVLSGLMGGLFSSAGPPMVYHLYRQPLTSDLIKQCLMLIFGINQVLRLLLVVGQGQFSLLAVWLSASALPTVYAVSWLQRRYAPPLNATVAKRMVCGLLSLTGASLLIPYLGPMLSHRF